MRWWLLVGAALPLLLLAFWQETQATGPFYGQDSAIYLMAAEHYAAGEPAALWNGCTAPALPWLAAQLLALGVPTTTAFHALALAGYLFLFGCVAFFLQRVARELEVPAAPATAGAVIVAAFFCLGLDVVRFGTTPLTDPLGIGCLLLAIGALERTPSPARALAVGSFAALGYLSRFSVFPLAGLAVLASALALAWDGRRTPLAAAGKLGLLALPIAVAICAVIFASRGRVEGFSWGFNTSSAANAAVGSERARRPDADVIRVLNDDGSFGFYRIDPAAPDTWDLARYSCRLDYRKTADMSGRVDQLVAHPVAGFVRMGKSVLMAAGYHGWPLVIAAGLAFLLLVLRRPGLRSLVAIGGCGLTLAGGLLLYFAESRYLWLPMVVMLAGVVPGAWWCWQRRSKLGLALGGALALFSLVHGALVLHGSWTGGERDRRIHEAIAAALPARTDGTIAAYKAGHVLPTGGRWLPTPVPERDSDTDRLLDVLRRGHVDYLVLWDMDWEHNPSIRPLFEGVPPGYELRGELRLPGESRPAARVLRRLAP